jgi:hypothetical protein
MIGRGSTNAVKRRVDVGAAQLGFAAGLSATEREGEFERTLREEGMVLASHRPRNRELSGYV